MGWPNHERQSASSLLGRGDHPFGRAALDTAVSLLQIDQLPEQGGELKEKFQPNGIIVDSDARSGVQSAFERIAAVKNQFSSVPVIALGNEMSAQLVLAALRAGADDFLDRDAGADQLRAAIRNCLTRKCAAPAEAKARIACVLSALPSEQDQDFALNLAVQVARSKAGVTLYLDLSLPMSQAGIALGLEPAYSVHDAIQDMARLDRALLESALARDPRSGLYVMPLSTDLRGDGKALEAAGFAALLQVLRNSFDAIVVCFGPFSRQPALLEMAGPAASFFLCCSQRFPSIRGAGEMLRWLAGNRTAIVPEIVVHELAPGRTPSPADIRKVLNVPASIDLEACWDELSDHLNDARPMALSLPRYAAGLDACLARMGLAEAPKPDLRARLRDWLTLVYSARPV
jgi:pilus assembly protein CpaE